MALHFREITRHNWLQCVRLKVRPEQEVYVASNAFSLAEAAYRTEFTPLGVYDGETMVGFVLYDLSKGKGWIVRLMIDAAHQGKGYGGWALRELIKLLQSRPDCREIYLDLVEGNTFAEGLYERVGFRRTGEIQNEVDVIAKLDWSR